MKYVFIDSNIWLSLYHFTDADLAEFEKLKNYINSQSLKVICTTQVYEEIQRNRENKLDDSIKRFVLKEPQYPVFVKGYESYDDISKEIRRVKASFDTLKEEINQDVLNRNLPADKTLNELLSLIGVFASDGYVDLARIRYLKGNPPGKKNSYGDAINWEALLNIIPNGCDLYLISNDKDYRSVVDEKQIDPFLENEWNLKKQSKVVFYNNLVDFLRDHANDIVLNEVREKRELINALRGSSSYANTHAIIAALNRFNNWSIDEIEDLCDILYSNSQVGDICFDPDVSDFYNRIIGDDTSQYMSVNSIKDVIELYKRQK